MNCVELITPFSHKQWTFSKNNTSSLINEDPKFRLLSLLQACLPGGSSWPGACKSWEIWKNLRDKFLNNNCQDKELSFLCHFRDEKRKGIGIASSFGNIGWLPHLACHKKSYAHPVSLMDSILHVADVTDYSNQSFLSCLLPTYWHVMDEYVLLKHRGRSVEILSSYVSSLKKHTAMRKVKHKVFYLHVAESSFWTQILFFKTDWWDTRH